MPSPFGYQPAGGNLDPFVAVLAATSQASSVMEKFEEKNTLALRPSQTKLGRFFKYQYEVGTEKLLRDMPPLILLEILATALLVLRNCLFEAFGEQAAKVKQNLLYIFAIDYPLRIFYGLVLFLRRAPRLWEFILVVLVLVSVLALVVGWNWRDSILYVEGSFSLMWFTIFIALPLFILVSEGIFLWKGKLTDKKWTYSFRGLLIAAGIAALLLINPVGLLAIVGTIFSRWENLDLIAQANLIIIALIIFLAPYVGASLLLNWSRRRRIEAPDLQIILANYLEVDDLARITQGLVSSEMIKSEALPQVLQLYMADEAINKVKQKIKLSEEIEGAQLQAVFRDYLPANRLR
jgi:hypothetical protein